LGTATFPVTPANEPAVSPPRAAHEWLTAAEAAEYLRLPSVEALYQRRARGQLKGYRMGAGTRGPLRFRRTDLDALMRAA
jgi:excisionase family DNA binding protein